MIESSVVSKAKKKKPTWTDKPMPRLIQHTTSGCVVLATSHQNGVLVDNSCCDRTTTKMGASWIICREENYIDFDKAIKLQNKD